MYFNFRRLIEKYSSEYTVVIHGQNVTKDNGDIVKGEPQEVKLVGAIISRGENAIFRSDGNLTAKDKRLHTLTPIDKALLNSQVVYENEVFQIQGSTDNSKFTGVYSYTLKYVSAFNEKGGGGE